MNADSLVVEEWNAAAKRAAGLAESTLSTLSVEEIFPDIPQIPALVREAAATGTVQSANLDYVMRSTSRPIGAEFRAVPLDDDRVVLFATLDLPAADSPSPPALDALEDSAAQAWLAEGAAAAYVWRIEQDGDFTLAEYNQKALEVTRGGVLKIKGLRAQSLYWDQPEFLRFLTLVRDEGRAETDSMSLRFVTGSKTLHVFRALGVRLDHHVIVFAVDRTAEHVMATKLATAEKRLRRAERLDSVGRLAGGIAHDFNNLLAAIIGLGEMLHDSVEEVLKADVRTLLDAADRGAALTKRLLAFARREEVSPRPFSVGELVAGLQPMLDRLLGPQVDLSLSLDRKLPSVFMDPSQLEQVLLNLIINAHEAMPEGGALSLRATLARLEGRLAFEGAGDGPFVLLEVEDEGVGIAPDLQELIFEPFVSSKDESSGAGLGLATVRSLVSQASGHVRVASEVGGGTTFTLLLPTSDEPPQRLGRSVDEHESETLEGRVLLVEDDALLRRVLRRSLRRMGFEVLVARDGRDALELMDSGTQHPIDVLVTDVVMPHVSGVELAIECRKRWPKLPVLLCSGHHTEDLSDGSIAPPVRFLNKPVPQQLLARTIRELIS